MNRVRVIAGNLKGRVIPFYNKNYDNADITPQKVKGAIFSKIGEELTGKGFLDLYAGSGQIGIEALSRGAFPVIFNEKDKKRFNFIRSFITELNLDSEAMLLNMTAHNAFVYLRDKKEKIDYIYIDPPYEKVAGDVFIYNEIIDKIEESGILKDNGRIIVQHFSNNFMDKKIGKFSLSDTKRYSNTSLSFYEIIP